METNHNDVDSNSQTDLDKNKKSSKPKKKSPKKTIKSSEKVLDSKSSFVLLQSSYKNWMKLRKVSIELFENIINTKSKLSHINQGQIGLTGILFSSSKISCQIYEDILDSSNSLKEIQESMIKELDLISNLQSSDNEFFQTYSIEEEFLASLLEQIRQQTSFEIVLANNIIGDNNLYSKDQDLSITIIACLLYPPYFSKDDLNLLLTFGD